MLFGIRFVHAKKSLPTDRHLSEIKKQSIDALSKTYVKSTQVSKEGSI